MAKERETGGCFQLKTKEGAEGRGRCGDQTQGRGPGADTPPGGGSPASDSAPHAGNGQIGGPGGGGFGCEHRSGRIPNRKREGVAKKANKLSGL